MKKLIFFSFVFVGVVSMAQNFIDYNKNGKQDIFENPSYSIEERVEDLLKQMTFEEKQGQLLMDLGWEYYIRQGDNITLSNKGKKAIKEKNIGSLWCFFRADNWTQKNLENALTPKFSCEAVNMLQQFMIDSTRLGIPILIAEECMHGIMQAGSVVFPTGLSQASTWNTSLIEKMAQQIGKQAKMEGINICFAPILDIAKDGRWSRVEESFGEDYFLVGEMGRSIVKGLKYTYMDDKKRLLPTLKHFAGYGNSEGGHNAGSSHLGIRELYSEILPPFKKAIDSGADLIMTAYNEVDGVPCSMNSFLLKNILREKWGFSGVVISDLHSISGLVSHRVAKDLTQATQKSINAGVDLDLSATDFYNNLYNIDSSRINEAVRRVLRLKFSSGLMDNPFIYQYDSNKIKNIATDCKNTALEIAEQSLILLKNREKTLPFNTKKKIKIALIGPNADNVYNQLGDYTAVQDSSEIITIKKAFEKEARENKYFEFSYTKGCYIRDLDKSGFKQALSIAKQNDIIVLCLGGSSSRFQNVEYENTGAAKIQSSEKETQIVPDITSGEGFDRSSLSLPGVQKELLDTLYSLGKPIILILINGRPLVLTDIEGKCSAILECFYPGAMGGEAIMNTLVGRNNPSGKLPISFPRSVGALPCYYNAKDVANRTDYLEGKATAFYPFGYGMSYTNFEYRNIKAQVKNKETDSVSVQIECEITNTGEYDGAEVVQVYIKKTTSDYATNNKQLCAFKKEFFRKGENKKIVLNIENEFFREWNIGATDFYLSKGEYKIMIGKDSNNIIKEILVNVE
ncbi:MAG: glycoside hydrolase family 3 N-terminal domain-containing protein [Bacteroidota bacterium]|nr:glycoside hydrolase family 3 N-terminal domain-containing protein [Bacteroidota bacterium]